MQILQVVLGETCARFQEGSDRGRDSFFRGVAAAKLLTQDAINGDFIVQCKHTSRDANLTLSTVSAELEKVKKLVANAPAHYILLTNYSLSANNERIIRTKFEGIDGVVSCIVRGEEWIETKIDSEPRLLRLVPRLFGLGDLSQLFASIHESQTHALLIEYKSLVEVFVPTLAYRLAEKRLTEAGMLVIAGPPAVGKTTVAACLCLFRTLQEPMTRILRIENAQEFKSSWSTSDRRTIFWIDDIFGETFLDHERLNAWASVVEKLRAAVNHGTLIVVTSRDYILREALEKMKESRSRLFRDNMIELRPEVLTPEERNQILYNHVKHGTMSPHLRQALKPYLAVLASRASFTPELARRLGDQRFAALLQEIPSDACRFFDAPTHLFCDMMMGLADSETAAMLAILASQGSLPDPVVSTGVHPSIFAALDVTVARIRASLSNLVNSLVQKTVIGTRSIWKFYHPSMQDALCTYIRGHARFGDVYVSIAPLADVVSHLSCREHSSYIFLSESLYPALLSRLCAESGFVPEITEFLAERTGPEFWAFAFKALGADSLTNFVSSLFLSTNCWTIIKIVSKLPLEFANPTTLERAWSALCRALDFRDLPALLVSSPCSAVFGVERLEALAREQIENDFADLEELQSWALRHERDEYYYMDLSSVVHNYVVSMDRGMSEFSVYTDSARNRLWALLQQAEDQITEQLMQAEERFWMYFYKHPDDFHDSLRKRGALMDDSDSESLEWFSDVDE